MAVATQDLRTRDRWKKQQGRALERAVGGDRPRLCRLLDFGRTRAHQKCAQGEGYISFKQLGRLASSPETRDNAWAIVAAAIEVIQETEDESFDTSELLLQVRYLLHAEQEHEGEETAQQHRLFEALVAWTFRSDYGLSLPQRQNLLTAAREWIRRARAEVEATLAAIGKLEVIIRRVEEGRA